MCRAKNNKGSSKADSYSVPLYLDDKQYKTPLQFRWVHNLRRDCFAVVTWYVTTRIPIVTWAGMSYDRQGRIRIDRGRQICEDMHNLHSIP
jgi:hypothetical protein